MGDWLLSSSCVAMLTGAAASFTSFSLEQDDSLLEYSPAHLGALYLMSLLET